MSGFYERLGTRTDASEAELREAYQHQLARLVKRLRDARENGADTAVLENEQKDLMEALGVLTDPARRRRYDRYRQLEGEDVPSDPEAFWEAVRPGMADPASSAALDVVREISSLPVGESLSDVPAPRADPPAPPPAPVAQEISTTLPEVTSPESTNPVVTEPLEVPSPPTPAARDLADADIEQMVATYGYDGRFLAAVRQARGISIEQVAEATKISSRYIEALETNAFDRLPSAIFVRGYLREISTVLGLAPDEVTEGYLELYTRLRDE
jgi:hypothetical protein